MNAIIQFPWKVLLMCLAITCLAPLNSKGAGLDETRATALKKFDRDSDGRLSDAERESMRKEVWRERLSGARQGRGRPPMPMPPEIVKKYDKDGDGRLDDEESQAAQEGIRRQFMEIQKKYDANNNGRIDPEEGEAISKDISDGKIEGMPRFFGRMMGRGRRGGFGRGGGGGVQVEVMKRADKDGDGRLSAEELDAFRAERAKSPPVRPEPQQGNP